MVRKLGALILLTTASATLSFAQKAPEPARPAMPGPLVSLTMEGFGGGYIGVALSEVTKDNFAKLGLGEVRGALVEKVVENSPAAEAGLQAGDVIVAFDGDKINGVRKFQRLMSEVAADHKVTLTVVRGGAEQQIVVTAAKRSVPAILGSTSGAGIMRELPRMPEMPQMPQIPEGLRMPQLEWTPGDDSGVIVLGDSQKSMFFGSSRQLGVSVSTMSRQLGEYFGTDGKGLLINDVQKDSAAAKAGLRAGDVILEVNGKPVADSMELVRAVNGEKEGDVTLTIIRDKQRSTIVVTPERIKAPQAPRVQMPAGRPTR